MFYFTFLYICFVHKILYWCDSAWGRPLVVGVENLQDGFSLILLFVSYLVLYLSTSQLTFLSDGISYSQSVGPFLTTLPQREAWGLFCLCTLLTKSNSCQSCQVAFHNWNSQ
jgi:hypothetical protein